MAYIWKSLSISIGPFLAVSTSRYEDHENIFSANDYLTKGVIYFLLKPWLGDGLLMSPGEKWHSRRKMLTPAFHFKILDQFVPVFNSNGEEFIRQVRKRADGRAFDIWSLSKLLTLDVICETIMGARVNAQINSNSPYVKAVNDISTIIIERSMKPWLLPPFIFRFSKLGRRHQQCLDVLHSTTEKVIQKRKAELEKLTDGKTLDVDELGRRRRVAFLDLLLLIARDDSLSDADIREEVDTFMFEGHDTTAAAISFTVFLLSRHPAVQEKILGELEAIFDCSKPLGPSIQELSQLKYLEMVIKESMRIYPPVSGVARQISSDLRHESNIYVYFLHISKVYGKTCRYYIGPLPFVYTIEIKDLETLLSRTKYIEKNFMYKLLRPWLGTGLLTSGGEKWQQRRKLLTPAFHFKILEQFVPVFNSCGEEFVRQLRRRADGNVFNVFPLVELLTLDVICETAMGVAVNAQTDSYSNYVKAVKKVSNITVARIFKPWYFFDSIFMVSPTGREYKKCLKVIHDTTDKVIRERKAELELLNGENNILDEEEIGRRRRLAFLDLLLLSARDGSLTDADIREEVDTFMFEGHDTTAVAISFTIFLLSRHIDVQEKVLSELESVFDPLQSLQPSLNQISELKYLEMVVKESLRLYPPVPIINRYNPEDTRLISGHIIPEGCSISLSQYTAHRDPEVFPEPERFIPERFSPEESARRHPYAYIPFSAGPRNCIGQRFAILELKSLLAKLVWNFRILPAPGFEPVLTWELTLKSQNGVQVRLEERRPN